MYRFIIPPLIVTVLRVVRTIQNPVVFLQAVFQSPSPYSPRSFAARLSAPPLKLYLLLQYRQLRRLLI